MTREPDSALVHGSQHWRPEYADARDVALVVIGLAIDADGLAPDGGLLPKTEVDVLDVLDMVLGPDGLALTQYQLP